MHKKNIVLTIREVEPGLVKAVKKLSDEIGYELHGITLIGKEFINKKNRKKDETGFFKEVVCDFDNPTSIQKALRPYIDNILLVTCRFETAIQQLRKTIPFLPYVNTSSDTALLWATEKLLMRDRLRDHDENLVPKYKNLTSAELSYVHKMINGMSFPIIIKPNGLNSSLLVKICSNESELQENLVKTFDVIHEVYKRERGAGVPSVLVEEVIHGDMYSVDGYVNSKGDIYCLPIVRVITANSVGKEGFYTYRTILPVDELPDEYQKSCFDATKSAVKALHLNSTTVHVELFHTGNGVWKIIELGPRIGGHREDIYREVYGTDHYYNDLLVRIDRDPVINHKHIKYASGFNVYADSEGIIRSIEGIDEIKKMTCVVWFKVHLKPGDSAVFAGNGGEVVAEGIISSPDKKTLEVDMQKIRKLLQIHVSN